MIKAIVSRDKNEVDFSVKVLKDGIAPQIFNNKPVIDCLIALKCSIEEIKNCKIIEGE
jgi:hypothetical protein